jgi:D-aminopeptidase
MTDSLSARLDRALQALPRNHPGPGGAVAVVRAGEVLVRHGWGWANAERRIPFTPSSLFRMCSITKQFTCAALLGTFPDPSVLDADLRASCRGWRARRQRARPLHNQSGLRRLLGGAMLQLAVEAPFGDQGRPA